MLYINNQTPFAATFLSDIPRPGQEPQVICVIKERYLWQDQEKSWILSDAEKTPIQDIDIWDPVSERRVSDLVPEKLKSELLLQGLMRPQTLIQIQEQGRLRTLVKTGYLAPDPPLYWQSKWRRRKKDAFLVVDPGCQLELDWIAYESLNFEGFFMDQPSGPEEARFFVPEKRILKGILSEEGAREARSVTFRTDTVIADVEGNFIDQVWRARFPWDLAGDSMGELKTVLD